VSENILNCVDAVLRVDSNVFIHNWEKVKVDIAALQLELNEAAGFQVNVGSGKDLQVFLFEGLKLTPLKVSIKTQRVKFDASVLKAYKHPLVGKVIELRHLLSIERSFRGVSPFIVGDRLSYSFHRGSTGLVYTKEPNVNSFPAELREAIIPDEGCLFVCIQYPYLELYVAAQFVGETGIVRKFNLGVDIFAELSEGFMEEEEAEEVVGAYLRGYSETELAFKFQKDVNVINALVYRFLSLYSSFAGWQGIIKAIDVAGEVEAQGGKVYQVVREGEIDPQEELRKAVNFKLQASTAFILNEAVTGWGSTEGLKFKLPLFDGFLIQMPSLPIEDLPGWLTAMKVQMQGNAVSSGAPVSFGVGSTWQEARVK